MSHRTGPDAIVSLAMGYGERPYEALIYGGLEAAERQAVMNGLAEWCAERGVQRAWFDRSGNYVNGGPTGTTFESMVMRDPVLGWAAKVDYFCRSLRVHVPEQSADQPDEARACVLAFAELARRARAATISLEVLCSDPCPQCGGTSWNERFDGTPLVHGQARHCYECGASDSGGPR